MTRVPVGAATLDLRVISQPASPLPMRSESCPAAILGSRFPKPSHPRDSRPCVARDEEQITPSMRTLLMHGRLTIPSLAVVGLLAVGLCQAWAQQPAAGRHGPSWDYAPLERVPEEDRARPNPLEGDPDAVAAGQKLFADHCVECHGENLGGTNRGISLASEEVRQASPGALFWVLTNGVVRRGMPVWSRLSELQRWQIVAFLTSIGASPAHASDPDPSKH